MACLEDELKDLREQNTELVHKVQHWKMTAAQRENEKLDLMKEINDLRLTLSRLRNNGSIQASNFDAALQSASEKALSHLVRASSEIARTMDLAKAYMRDRQEIDAASPRWSSIGNTPNSDKKDKVHRVPPLMMGGQSIQPVVALTMLNTSHTSSITRSPNQNRNVTRRAVPMHLLQDVYIPLTRIDARESQSQSMETEPEADEAEDNSEDEETDGNEEREIDESQHISEDDNFETSQRLDVVAEESEDEIVTPPRRNTDNPLEGPSWLLNTSSDNNQVSTSKSTNLEPDSTTELEGTTDSTPPIAVNNQLLTVPVERLSCEFSPTVRRRKRTSSPPAEHRSLHYSPRPPTARRTSNSGRVLKVLVAKMRLEGEEAGSPPKRAAPAQFDAPSPNGATVAGVIVSEDLPPVGQPAAEPESPRPRPSERRNERILDRDEDIFVRSRARNDRSATRDDRARRGAGSAASVDSRDSDSSGSGGGETRGRRTRKVVTYKEKPLNRKMRR